MGYLEIPNLYKEQDILLFKECYALEKIHGTSAHISWNENKLSLFSGENKDYFINMFNHEFLKNEFTKLNIPKISIFGEFYGGKCQGMSDTYGKIPRFVSFEVKIGENWLSVPNAEEIVKIFNLDFVPYTKCLTDIKLLDELRDKPSDQSIKCGILEPRKREGIVLRPLIEVRKNNGSRIIAKHKADDFRETKNKRSLNKNELLILSDAKAIAEEWVTEMRLSHVLQEFEKPTIEDTGKIIKAMFSDIVKESKGEVEYLDLASKEISRKTALMFKNRLKNSLLLKK
jgi:hypothetical protein